MIYFKPHLCVVLTKFYTVYAPIFGNTTLFFLLFRAVMVSQGHKDLLVRMVHQELMGMLDHQARRDLQ